MFGLLGYGSELGLTSGLIPSLVILLSVSFLAARNLLRTLHSQFLHPNFDMFSGRGYI
jgi:hypothetical protein